MSLRIRGGVCYNDLWGIIPNLIKERLNVMRVLIACEESQRVCLAFRDRGHEAFSCDILPCSGGHPEWHIRGDALGVMNGNCCFRTSDGEVHVQYGAWDLLIAHPPCTYLCLSGQKHCNEKVYGEKALERQQLRDSAVQFFFKFVYASAVHIAIENPVGVMTRYYRKPDQYIQPYWFGDPCIKRTGLWLKNLPILVPTDIVEPEYVRSGTGKVWSKWFWDTSCISDREERSKVRSKTFPGIARAMAEQWGDYVERSINGELE